MGEILNTRMFKWKKKNPTGIAQYMDIIILKKECTIYNKPLNEAKTIFIHTRGKKGELIFYFIDNILPKLIKPVNIIIAGEDYTFPNNTDCRMKSVNHRLKDFINLGKHKMINKLFVENLDQDIENALPIPLGINPKEGPTNFNYFLQFENINKNKPLKFTNFNRARNGKGQWKERSDVAKICNKYWKDVFVETEHLNHKLYLKTMGSYLFTICVHGGGLDVNPKLWEALLIGVIPIIKENKPYTDIYINFDLPVVIVKKWDVDTINENNLIMWYEKYYNYFTDKTKRQNMLEILSLDYWVNYITTLLI